MVGIGTKHTLWTPKKLIEKSPGHTTIANRSQPPDAKRKRNRAKKHAQNKHKMHAKHMGQLLPSPSEAYWAIFVSFNFTYIVQKRPCTNEALIINYTELCYGWNRKWTYFLNSKNVSRKFQTIATPRHQEENKKQTNKKKQQTNRAKRTRMHEKHIDQLPLPKRGLLGYIAIFYLYIHCTNEALYKRGPGRVRYRFSQ